MPQAFRLGDERSYRRPRVDNVTHGKPELELVH